MSEHVMIRYPEQRDVLIDDVLAGETNQLLQVREGFHSIRLDGPVDYWPPTAGKMVSGTSAEAPSVISFAPVRSRAGWLDVDEDGNDI